MSELNKTDESSALIIKFLREFIYISDSGQDATTAENMCLYLETYDDTLSNLSADRKQSLTKLLRQFIYITHSCEEAVMARALHCFISSHAVDFEEAVCHQKKLDADFRQKQLDSRRRQQSWEAEDRAHWRWKSAHRRVLNNNDAVADRRICVNLCHHLMNSE